MLEMVDGLPPAANVSTLLEILHQRSFSEVQFGVLRRIRFQPFLRFYMAKKRQNKNNPQM